MTRTITNAHSFVPLSQPTALSAKVTMGDILVAWFAHFLTNPLAARDCGHRVTETRDFDARYFPAAIEAELSSTLLDWTCDVDAIGNILAITDGLSPTGDRDFAYEDGTWFLTQADGPWGDLTWTYDRIGNRLTQTRNSATDTYSYLPSGSGNTPLLDAIALSGSGAADDTWGAATPVGDGRVVALVFT